MIKNQAEEVIVFETINEKLREIERNLLCAENNLRNIQTNIDGAERIVPTFNPNNCTEDIIQTLLFLSDLVLNRTVSTQQKIG